MNDVWTLTETEGSAGRLFVGSYFDLKDSFDGFNKLCGDIGVEIPADLGSALFHCDCLFTIISVSQTLTRAVTARLTREVLVRMMMDEAVSEMDLFIHAPRPVYDEVRAVFPALKAQE